MTLWNSETLLPRERVVNRVVAEVGAPFASLFESANRVPSSLAYEGRTHAATVGASGPAAPPAVRYVLPADVGSGYCDVVGVIPQVLLSIVDCAYRMPVSLRVPGGHLCSMLILCSGNLLDRARDRVYGGPGIFILYHPHDVESRYYLDSLCPVKLVALHFNPDRIAELLGLSYAEICAAFAVRKTGDHADQIHKVAPPTHDILVAAREVLDSRYNFQGSLRQSFLHAKSREILTRFVTNVGTKQLGNAPSIGLSKRDRDIVNGARAILLENYQRPPPICRLARQVGMSQTKLKASFKLVTGATIHAFIQDVRMSHASDLLLRGEFTVSDVAHAVGYEHPANFACAFKRHFGVSPRTLKPRNSRAAACPGNRVDASPSA